MQLTSCLRLQIVRPQTHLSTRLRTYPATVAFGSSSDTATPAGEVQAKTSVTKPQRQSRLQQQEATAWPGVDFSSLHSQVCTLNPSRGVYRDTSEQATQVLIVLQSPSVRVRQHVNPFTPTLQVCLLNVNCGQDMRSQLCSMNALQIPVPPLDWGSVYADACRPLAIDIGCGECPLPATLLYCSLVVFRHAPRSYHVHLRVLCMPCFHVNLPTATLAASKQASKVSAWP